MDQLCRINTEIGELLTVNPVGASNPTAFTQKPEVDDIRLSISVLL